MRRITPYLRAADATPRDAEAFLAERPATARYLEGLDASTRSRLRSKLTKEGYTQPVVSALLPASRARPGERPDSYWGILSQPARDAIQEKLGVDSLSDDPSDWTPAMASAAADAIVDHYGNVHSTVNALAYLRHALSAIFKNHPGLTGVINSTYRTEVTEAHNELVEAGRAERASGGINIPEQYQRIADLRDRVINFIDNPRATPMAAADLLVALSARPGEAQRLEMGPKGALRGALKRRGDDSELPLVSALGERLATDLIFRWRELPATERAAAMKRLPTLTQQWGLNPKDLRAIGASLAVRRSQMDGGAHNGVQCLDVQRAALRHANTARTRPASDRYAVVNDRDAGTVAALAELSDADAAKVRELVLRLST